MSIAAENVIGGIIIGGKEAYWQVADMLRPEDFPTASLSNLYRLCGDIAKSAADLDIITEVHESERQNVMAAADVVALSSSTARAANMRSQAGRVKSAAVEPRVRAICAEGAKSGDVATVQAELTALLSAQPGHAVSAAEALK